MALSRVKNWIAGEVLTASDLNTEFNNLINNPGSLICPIGFNLTFTDATYDIGASGATRPRDLYLSRNATIGGDLTWVGAGWTTRTFSAGDFTASGSMTWTVASGDVVTDAYIIHGKMMTYAFDIQTTTVGGTPSASLLIAIPASKTATKLVTNAIAGVIDNNVLEVGGFASVQAAGTKILLQRGLAGNWTASTDQTNVRGQITFEIN